MALVEGRKPALRARMRQSCAMRRQPPEVAAPCPPSESRRRATSRRCRADAVKPLCSLRRNCTDPDSASIALRIAVVEAHGAVGQGSPRRRIRVRQKLLHAARPLDSRCRSPSFAATPAGRAAPQLPRLRVAHAEVRIDPKVSAPSSQNMAEPVRQRQRHAVLFCTVRLFASGACCAICIRCPGTPRCRNRCP